MSLIICSTFVAAESAQALACGNGAGLKTFGDCVKSRMPLKVYCVCDTLCGLANGDITIIGTRKPSRVYQTCGGGRLSYHPPQSSHRTTIAVSFQYWLVPIALTTLVSQGFRR